MSSTSHPIIILKGLGPSKGIFNAWRECNGVTPGTPK